MARLKDSTVIGAEQVSQLTEAEIEAALQDDEPSVQSEESTEQATPPESEEEQETWRQPALRKPGQVKAEGKINLDDLPEFRNYKSQKDKEVEAERQRRLALEQQIQAVQLAAYERQLQEQAQSYDPEKQQAANQQLSALQFQRFAAQMQAWETAKRQRLASEGLDPNDERFNKVYPGGQPGLRQFEAELAVIKSERLERENRELKGKVEGIDAIIQRKVAESLRGMGFDTADMGDNAIPSDAASRYEQDQKRLQMGKMSPEEFIKKYG